MPAQDNLLNLYKLITAHFMPLSAAKTLDADTLTLRIATPSAWIETVLANFDLFLIDHAQAEKKASGMALSMLTHYPDKADIVNAMMDLAIEELAHFREVLKLMQSRGLTLNNDEKDPYVNGLRSHMRKGSDAYMLDRLLIAAIIEARGCERFGLVALHHRDPDISRFYQLIADSESKHYQLFLDLAENYFTKDLIRSRLDELLDIEAEIIQTLALRSALH